MLYLPAQKLSTLFFPMLIVALLAGAFMGGLGGALFVLPELIASSSEPEQFNGWGGPVGYSLLPIIYGTVCGTILALIPCTGSYAALAILDRRFPSPSGNNQAVAAGAGAAVAGVLPAVFVVWIIGVGGMAALAIGTVFVVLCFFIAQLALRGILRFTEKRDAVVRKAS